MLSNFCTLKCVCVCWFSDYLFAAVYKPFEPWWLKTAPCDRAPSLGHNSGLDSFCANTTRRSLSGVPQWRVWGSFVHTRGPTGQPESWALCALLEGLLGPQASGADNSCQPVTSKPGTWRRPLPIPTYSPSPSPHCVSLLLLPICLVSPGWAGICDPTSVSWGLGLQAETFFYWNPLVLSFQEMSFFNRSVSSTWTAQRASPHLHSSDTWIGQGVRIWGVVSQPLARGGG